VLVHVRRLPNRLFFTDIQMLRAQSTPILSPIRPRITSLRSRPGASNDRCEDVNRLDGATLEPATLAAIAAATAERSSAATLGTGACLANAERSLLH